MKLPIMRKNLATNKQKKVGTINIRDKHIKDITNRLSIKLEVGYDPTTGEIAAIILSPASKKG